MVLLKENTYYVILYSLFYGNGRIRRFNRFTQKRNGYSRDIDKSQGWSVILFQRLHMYIWKYINTKYDVHKTTATLLTR